MCPSRLVPGALKLQSYVKAAQSDEVVIVALAPGSDDNEVSELERDRRVPYIELTRPWSKLSSSVQNFSSRIQGLDTTSDQRFQKLMHCE